MKKYNAFSMVETIAALLIVSISMGITFLMYTSLVNQKAPGVSMKADILLNNLMLKAKSEQRFGNRTELVNGLTIQQKFYQRDNNLYVFELVAVAPDSKAIHSIRELIYYPVHE